MNPTIIEAMKLAAHEIASIDTTSFIEERDRQAAVADEYAAAIAKADARLEQLTAWRREPVSADVEGRACANMLLGRASDDDRPSHAAIESEMKTLHAGRRQLAIDRDALRSGEDARRDPVRVAMAAAVAPVVDEIAAEAEVTAARLADLFAMAEAIRRVTGSGSAGMVTKRLGDAVAELAQQSLAPRAALDVPEEVRKAFEPAAGIVALIGQAMPASVATPRPDLHLEMMAA